jgi:hypothetical protein
VLGFAVIPRYDGFSAYLLYCNLEVKLSNWLTGSVGEDSSEVDLARRTGHTTGVEIDSKLCVQNLHLVCRRQGVALWKGRGKVPFIILGSSLSCGLRRWVGASNKVKQG